MQNLTPPRLSSCIDEDSELIFTNEKPFVDLIRISRLIFEYPRGSKLSI